MRKRVLKQQIEKKANWQRGKEKVVAHLAVETYYVIGKRVA